MNCKLPPAGWRCSRDEGHEGPCAAWPDTFWLKLKWMWFFRGDLQSMKAIWQGHN